jgi:hypothetical protein
MSLQLFRENFELMKLLEANGYTEENSAFAVRAHSYEIAETIVEANLAKVLALADHLTEHGRIKASEALNLIGS